MENKVDNFLESVFNKCSIESLDITADNNELHFRVHTKNHGSLHHTFTDTRTLLSYSISVLYTKYKFYLVALSPKGYTGINFYFHEE